MGIQPNYSGLPFSWKSPETMEIDKRWLESVIRNAAPFSDSWTMARIVQMAHQSDTVSDRGTYAGLSSEAAIVQALRETCDLDLYRGFAAVVHENYVIKTLNHWVSKRFSLAVARNFEVYADRQYENVFLVTSTATPTLRVDRHLPPLQRFRPLFNVNELAWLMRYRSCEQLTLRTHGFASPANSFYGSFAVEAEAMNHQKTDHNLGVLSSQQMYVGYSWPSEQPIFDPELWFDFRRNLDITVKFVYVIGGVSGIVGLLLYALVKVFWVPLLQLIAESHSSHILAWWSKANLAAVSRVEWYWIVPTVFLLWVLAFQLLRISVYQRDRYRAIIYGAPDLAEFCWRLDKALDRPKCWPTKTAITARVEQAKNYTLRVNIVGHSMGALVMVNMLRILSDRFGKDDHQKVIPDFMPVATPTGEHLVAQGGDEGDLIGQYLQLDKLILASPDIPLELLREGRNNYVRSAIGRCQRIYLLSSDRDVVLRYLSTIGNWFTEPSIEMAGLRLGNVYLRRSRSSTATPQYQPVLRNLLRSRPVADRVSAYDLFEKFNYLDCSEVAGLNIVPWRLLPYTGVLIDLINTAFYFDNRIDVHGGYFWTHTSTFEILKFLMMADGLGDDDICKELNRLIKGTPIRFLPSQPFLSS